MKVKKEYYIYPLLSLVSDFGHFPFLLDRAAQMGTSDLTRVWEGYILGYGAKMGYNLTHLTPTHYSPPFRLWCKTRT